MDNAAEKIFAQLKEDISAYAGLKLRLLKLMAVERTAKVIAVLSQSMLLLLLVFFTILFFFLALGFYLGELLDNLALGFLIVGGGYLLLTLGVLGMKDKIQVRLVNIVIGALLENDDENNKDQSEDSSRPDYSGKEGDPTAMPGGGNENIR